MTALSCSNFKAEMARSSSSYLWIGLQVLSENMLLVGGRLWLEFSKGCGWKPGNPSLEGLLDFCDALAVGVASDRGCNRVSKARSAIQAMKFAASKLGLHGFLDVLHAPAVKAWLDQGKWHTVPAREEAPLPLHVCKSLENALDTCEIEDEWLLLCFLLMLWGGLRWSDARRQELTSLVLDQGSLRGWSWRTKSSVSGMPWGVLTGGITGKNWGRRLGHLLSDLAQKDPGRDCPVVAQGPRSPIHQCCRHFAVASCNMGSSIRVMRFLTHYTARKLLLCLERRNWKY